MMKENWWQGQTYWRPLHLDTKHLWSERQGSEQHVKEEDSSFRPDAPISCSADKKREKTTVMQPLLPWDSDQVRSCHVGV